MVVVQRIVVGVSAMHKVILVGRLRERDGALASRVAGKVVLAYPHNPVVFLYVTSFKDRAVVNIMNNTFFGLGRTSVDT